MMVSLENCVCRKRHIDQAVKQLFSNPNAHALQGALLIEKILVCSAVQLVREGSEEAYFPVNDLIDRAIEILRALNITEPSRAQLLLSHQRLLDMNLLQPMTDGTCGDRVGTPVQGDAVGYALRDDPSSLACHPLSS
jgi:hypothetical protein